MSSSPDSPAIAIVTTCKGRLHHLKETLPLMAGQGADELVVVDYACPDGTGDWVEANYPQAKVVRVADGGDYSAPHARNLGVAGCRADWIAFVDADIKLAPRWIEVMRKNLRPGTVFRSREAISGKDLEKFGTAVCSRADFDRVGGFDEALTGWGGENYDFFVRLAGAGVPAMGFPDEFLEVIRHSDEERASFEGLADRDERTLLVVAYTEAKQQLRTILGRREGLTLEERQNIRQTILAKVKAWSDGGRGEPLRIRFAFDRGVRNQNAKYPVKSKVTVELEVAPDSTAAL